MIVPISAYGTIYDLRWGIQLAVQFESEEMLAEGEYEVIGAMRQIRGLDPLEENDFAINQSALFEQEFQSMKMVIYGIGIFLTGLALFVGGIGVMNIMFVSVKREDQGNWYSQGSGCEILGDSSSVPDGIHCDVYDRRCYRGSLSPLELPSC